MAGSHEVRGSIPLGSTNEVTRGSGQESGPSLRVRSDVRGSGKGVPRGDG